MTEYNVPFHQWPLVRGLVAGCLLLAPLSASASESALSTIIDEHWLWVLEQYPERRLEYGDRSGNNQWTDMSPEAFQRRYDDEDGGNHVGYHVSTTMRTSASSM